METENSYSDTTKMLKIKLVMSSVSNLGKGLPKISEEIKSWTSTINQCTRISPLPKADVYLERSTRCHLIQTSSQEASSQPKRKRRSKLLDTSVKTQLKKVNKILQIPKDSRTSLPAVTTSRKHRLPKSTKLKSMAKTRSHFVTETISLFPVIT